MRSARNAKKIRAIDEYTLKNQRPPQHLDDLVDANILSATPVDPITNKKDWAVQFGGVEITAKERVTGIVDGHSNSDKKSSRGDRYNTW